jgi:hypothetical protein
VQLSEGVVSFVCAEDDPKNTAKYVIGKCTDSDGGELPEACEIMKGNSCTDATGCVVNGEGSKLEYVNDSWSRACDFAKGKPTTITGPPVSYDEGMKQIGC